MNYIYCQDIFYGKRLLQQVAIEGMDSCNSSLNSIVSPGAGETYYSYNIYFSRNYAIKSDNLTQRLGIATNLQCFKEIAQ